ncbi:MAG TPA: NAD(P)-dependent oxidoreductase [Stellaceae bacterium]|nr:NAD(P)-dependent oxidoreductase [Stellaceae bacterium]
MKALFVDCIPDMASIFAEVGLPGDPSIDLNTAPFDPDTIPELLAGYQICIDDHSFFPAAILERCKDLKHIVFLGTGAASYIDLDAAARLGITVSTIKGYGDIAVAEHTMALLMAAARGIARMDGEIRAGVWQTYEGFQLTGKTIGLVGFGGIGREMARLAGGIGMKVLAWNRSPVPDAPVPMVSLEEVLSTSHVVSLHLALNDATRGMIGKAQFASMRPGVIFVNTARAAVVDEAAMLENLRSGHVSHAALDVFHDEPLKPGNPYQTIPNVTITSHSGFRTPEATMTLLRRGIDIAIEKMRG